MKTPTRIGLAAFALLALTACRPKIQIGSSFVGDVKVAREMIQADETVGTQDNSQQLYNYYVEICDIEGKETVRCKTSLVLENIVW